MLIEENRLGRMVRVYKKMTDSEQKELLLERMIEENKAYIYELIKPYYCERFEIDELFNEAVSALIESINYYNPNYKPKKGKKKAKFTTYIHRYIDGRMKTYTRINSRDIHTDFYPFKNYKIYKETIYNMTIDSEGKKPTNKEVLEYFNKYNILYESNSQTRVPWDENRINLMKCIDAQTEAVYYHNSEDDSDIDMTELLEDKTLESPYEYANKKLYKESVDNILNKYNNLNINDKVVNIIKLRNGYLDEESMILIKNAIKKYGIEKFGLIHESERLTLEQISYIYGITRENARVLSDIGIRQLQILAGTNPEIEIKEEHRFPFLTRDLNIKPKQLKDIEFVDYDKNIININSENGYINAKKQGETDLVIYDHINDREVTYHIKVTPKYKDNEYNRYKAKKLALRKEANNE